MTPEAPARWLELRPFRFQLCSRATLRTSEPAPACLYPGDNTTCQGSWERELRQGPQGTSPEPDSTSSTTQAEARHLSHLQPALLST